jgi:uncharacterized protein (DUF305 family)
MTAHHQGAVDMALLAQTHADHPELKTLAKNIVADQRREIDQMREWRTQWFNNAPPAINMKLPGMTETMSGMDMNRLDQLKANDFDKEFIRQMIPHHEGALVMAKALAEQTTRPELKAFASSVIKEQAAEIAKMKEWQASWSK